MKIEKLDFKYNDENVLENVRLVINNKDKIALTGENGSGKSTLLKVIANKLTPDKGSLDKNYWEILSYVKQEPFSEEKPDVGIIDYFAKKDIEVNDIQQVAIKLGFSNFEEFVYNDLSIDKLSGGQRKILALAIAISKNPDTLILDEPENYLDIVYRKKLVELLKKYKGKLIFVSHDQFIIDALSNKIAVLEDGKINLFGEKDYDDVVDYKKQEKLSKVKDWKHEKREIDRLKKALVIMQLKARFSTKGQGVYRSRKREVEKRLAELGQKPSADTFQMFFPDIKVEKKAKNGF